MNIIFPNDTGDIINSIRGAIGRNVTFYREYKTICPASGCSINPITDTSTNPMCVVCSGTGYIYTISGVSVLAHVTWGQADIMGWVTGGKLIDGDCRIQVEYSVANLGLIDNAKYILVDDKKCTIRKRMLRGVPAVNRILLDLQEEVIDGQ